MIPTGVVSGKRVADQRHIAIATLLGVGPGSRDEPKRRYVHADRGSVHVMPLPTDAELASFTTAVIANNRMKLPATDPSARANAKALPVPERAGEPSPIEYIVYVVKENRTYDQVLGDLGKGNGDPSLTMFGESVTPNQHKLAREFVTLDNFYAAGGNSADGHQWLTQANETDYCLWPGYAGRSYPFDGSDPIAPAPVGSFGRRAADEENRPDLRRVCGSHARASGAASAIPQTVERRNRLHRQVESHSSYRVDQSDSGEKLPGIQHEHSGCRTSTDFPFPSQGVGIRGHDAEPGVAPVAEQSYTGDECRRIQRQGDGCR